MRYKIKRKYRKADVRETPGRRPAANAANAANAAKSTKAARTAKTSAASAMAAKTIAAVSCVFVILFAVVLSRSASKSALAPIPTMPITEIIGSDDQAEDLSDGAAGEFHEAGETVDDGGADLFAPFITDDTVMIDRQYITAKSALLADADSGEILCSNRGLSKIYPASMTKVMTLLVASEHLDSSQMDDTYTMTHELLQPLVDEHASRVGFEEGETVTIRDMVYGLILPSGADAAVGLCNYIAGSEEDFALLMNEKADELGLTHTHFVNSSGLHDENHYTTCAEMAAIMKAAMDDPFCRRILSTYTYVTSQTEQHPEGIEIFSDMFSRMYGTEVEGVVITAGKTGYTDEAGQCLVSYAKKGGKRYILVLGGDKGRYGTVYSTFNVYGNYLP